MTAEPIAFDFRAAPRIHDTLYGQLQGLQTRFAPHLQTLLGARLRQACDIDVVAPASVTLPDYTSTCVPPAIRFVCGLDRHAGQSMVCTWTAPLAMHAVARLFGGEGGEIAEPRPLTELEQSVLRDLLTRALPHFTDSGRPGFNLDCRITSLAGDAAPAIAALGDSLIALAWSVRCGSVDGTITTTLPATLFADRIVDEQAMPARELAELHLRNVKLPLEARLHFRLPASQLTRLQEGLVLETGKPSMAEVEVSSNGRPMFAGVLGRHHGHVGVQVTRVITPDPDAPTTQRRTPA